MTVELKGADDFARFARALKEAGDKDLRKSVGKALREQAKPLGMRVIREGAQAMPRRGGFAAQVAQPRVGTRFSGSKDPSVTLLLSDKSNHDLKSLDEGDLRHPVFARGGGKKDWRWTSQRVPARKFTEAFEREAPTVANAAVKAVQEVLDEVARKA